MGLDQQWYLVEGPAGPTHRWILMHCTRASLITLTPSVAGVLWPGFITTVVILFQYNTTPGFRTNGLGGLLPSPPPPGAQPPSESLCHRPSCAHSHDYARRNRPGSASDTRFPPSRTRASAAFRRSGLSAHPRRRGCRRARATEATEVGPKPVAVGLDSAWLCHYCAAEFEPAAPA